MTELFITRRKLIELAAVLLAGAAINGRVMPEAGGTSTTLADVFGHEPEAARAIGLQYLREYPDEGTPEALVSAILDSAPDLPRPIEALTVSDLRTRLRRHFAQDFANGNTVSIEGWVLSRTEIRLCALWACS